MADPVAVITGAGRGIGRATALEFSKAGYRVVLAARDSAALEETAKLCGRESVVVATDVTKPDDVERLFSTTLEKFGRIDVLVNNAGLAPIRSITEMSVDEWHAVLDTNLSAAFYTTRAAWPIFEKQGGGAVVNLSSAAARDPFPGFAAYGAAKAAINLFSLALAREGQPKGIRVYTVAPSATETGMFRRIMTERQYPREKTLDPADVARVILQCARGDLQYSSGEVIYLHKSL
jgi:NAD(P)-dependent dehydrogenase (short-subunit alcohol dehydrogenase family)